MHERITATKTDVLTLILNRDVGKSDSSGEAILLLVISSGVESRRDSCQILWHDVGGHVDVLKNCKADSRVSQQIVSRTFQRLSPFSPLQRRHRVALDSGNSDRERAPSISLSAVCICRNFIPLSPTTAVGCKQPTRWELFSLPSHLRFLWVLAYRKPDRPPTDLHSCENSGSIDWIEETRNKTPCGCRILRSHSKL